MAESSYSASERTERPKSEVINEKFGKMFKLATTSLTRAKQVSGNEYCSKLKTVYRIIRLSQVCPQFLPPFLSVVCAYIPLSYKLLVVMDFKSFLWSTEAAWHTFLSWPLFVIRPSLAASDLSPSHICSLSI